MFRFVKLAYNMESWETFDTLVEPTIEELKKHGDQSVHYNQIKILELLVALSSVNPSRVKKKFVMLKTEDTSNAEPSILSKSRE